MENGEAFSCDELSISEGNVILRFSGDAAKAVFERESGGHRVQQVSPTEKRGRVHSSTVTVAVLEEPTNADLKIKPRDLRVETYRAPGKGGQHRNTTDTAVRITHIPTGISACSTMKSQHRNKELALANLRARLSEAARDKNNSLRDKKRRKQIGKKASRSDKIRTIAYQRGRVENHINGKRMKISRYERGFIEELY